jgi:hypothetical protein
VLDFFGVEKMTTEKYQNPLWAKSMPCHVVLFVPFSKGCQTRLIQRLSNQVDTEKHLGYPSQEGSSYQVHFSVWITLNIAHELFQKSKETESLWQTLSKSLILRQEYSIALHASKRTQRHIVTTKVSSSSDMDELEWKEEAGIWISLPTVNRLCSVCQVFHVAAAKQS